MACSQGWSAAEPLEHDHTQYLEPRRGDGTNRVPIRRPSGAPTYFTLPLTRGFARCARSTPGYHPPPLRGYKTRSPAVRG
jgi:hypothetical protein